MQTIVSYDNVRALIPRQGRTDDLPQSVTPHNQQRRTEEMVKAMPVRRFTPDEIATEQRRLDEALMFMRSADVRRVMNWTDLKSPFARQRHDWAALNTQQAQ